MTVGSRWSRIKERMQFWIVLRLPKWVIYFAVIRSWAHATTGQFSDVDITLVTVDWVLRAWSDVPVSKDELQDSFSMEMLEEAWGIIANAGGGAWETQDDEWQWAAEKWRDKYHVILDAYTASYRNLERHEVTF